MPICLMSFSFFIWVCSKEGRAEREIASEREYSSGFHRLFLKCFCCVRSWRHSLIRMWGQVEIWKLLDNFLFENNCSYFAELNGKYLSCFWSVRLPKTSIPLSMNLPGIFSITFSQWYVRTLWKVFTQVPQCAIFKCLICLSKPKDIHPNAIWTEKEPL